MSDFYKLFKRNDRYAFLVPAVVTDNRDPENLGRIKVRFPWEDGESNWIRVSVPMAGKERGFFFMPEVNDEVLVAFLYGDTNYPVVIGFLWNGEDRPPEEDPSIRMLKTSSGIKIVINDSEGSVEISNKKGDRVIIEDGNRIKIKTGSSQISLDGSKNEVEISGGTTVKIKGTKLEITGTNIEIKADAVLTLKGSIVRIN
ncbi:phage baseplate assembly protein V [Persephonella sp.]